MTYCVSCGAKASDNDAFCPVCGKSLERTNATMRPGLADNVAGMLAYFTIVPAVVFLVMEPYNKRPFVRFHAFQSIFLWVACVAAGIGLSMLGMLPVIRWAALLLWPLLGLGELVVWLLCLLKAYQGQMYKLPIIGEMAEKQISDMPSSQAKAA